MSYEPDETSVAPFKSYFRKIRGLQFQERISQRKQRPVKHPLKNVVTAALFYETFTV